VNSDRGDSVQRRHEFFSSKMREAIKPQLKDANRLFGALEREIIYYRDQKKCAVCGADVVWQEAEIHHVDQHAKGGLTEIENGALVHSHCHPKGKAADEFVKKWQERQKTKTTDRSLPSDDDSSDDQNGNGEAA
jgi:hypothetical protein